jgi:microcystin-dependent protein
MAYTILKSDGTVLTTIADGLLDKTTSLGLPGPNFVGYGQILNENLVYLLENFASNTAPTSNNLQGQLWFDKYHQTLKVFTDQGYLPVAGITVGTVQPINAQDGNIWFNTTTNQMYLYGSGIWTLIGPGYTRAQGISGAIPVSLADQSTQGVNHNVIQLQFGNVVLATLSSDAAFVPTPAMPGFSHIYPGLTINESLIAGSAQLYSNANTAAYLPHDFTIQNIQGNVAALTTALASNIVTLNSAITTANVGMLGYVTDQLNSVKSTVINGLSMAENLANVAVANVQSALGSQINDLQTVVNSDIQANISDLRETIRDYNLVASGLINSQQGQINSLISRANHVLADVANFLEIYGGPISATNVRVSQQPWPPAVAGSYDTNAVNTTYVNSVLPFGIIVMWGGPIGNIPAGWQLCNGTNGTPDLRNRFVIGAGNSYGVGATGGATSVALSNGNLPAHSHSASSTFIGNALPTHNHSAVDSGHSHSYNYQTNDFPQSGSSTYCWSGHQTVQTGVGYAQVTIGQTSAGTPSGSVTTSIANAGSSTAFSTMPPYYALCYIQKMY